MSLQIGIVGLPNVGKSTLFNALTKNDVLAANYPFATIEPNVGVVPVPDPRLGVLAGIFGSARELPATVEFVDIAGIVKGASEGQGLGNKFLANIRESDAICQVIRVFADPDVVHVDGRVSPADDIETINTELILADLQTLEKALPRLQKEARTNKERAAASWPPPRRRRRSWTRADGLRRRPRPSSRCASCSLLTAKPFLYVFNLDDDELADAGLRAELSALVAPAEAIFLDAKIEAELVELDDDEALELLQSSGQSTSPGWLSSLGSGSRPWACRRTSRPGPRSPARGRSTGATPLPRRPASSTPTSSAASSRPRSCPSPTSSTPARWPRRRPAARSASRARTTSWPTATSSSSASTSDGGSALVPFEVLFGIVVTARFLLPLLILRYPLPAIIGCLVLDAVDQTVFQAFGYDPPFYQGYDKAMDVFYLGVAYVASLRNWTNLHAFNVSRFLFFYRQIGVVAFELTPGARAPADLPQHLRVLLHRL